MAEFPKVSVVIPAYNVAPYLGETLESVLAQTRQDYEVIVVNDGSQDETAQVAESFRERFAGKLVYLWQENRGLAGARNTAIQAARGEFIALLDGDDTWMPNYLAVMVGRLEADATIDLIFPNALFWGSPKHGGGDYQSILPPNPPVTLERLLLRQSNIFGLATVRRALLLAVSGYDEALRSAEDYDLWMRLLKRGCRFEYTTEPLVRYRYRSNSLSNSGIKHYENKMKALQKVLAVSDLTPAERTAAEREFDDSQATLDWHLYREKLLVKDYAGAAHYLGKANAYRRMLKWSVIRAGLVMAPAFTARFLIERLNDEIMMLNGEAPVRDKTKPRVKS